MNKIDSKVINVDDLNVKSKDFAFIFITGEFAKELRLNGRKNKKFIKNVQKFVVSSRIFILSNEDVEREIEYLKRSFLKDIKDARKIGWELEEKYIKSKVPIGLGSPLDTIENFLSLAMSNGRVCCAGAPLPKVVIDKDIFSQKLVDAFPQLKFYQISARF